MSPSDSQIRSRRSPAHLKRPAALRWHKCLPAILGAMTGVAAATDNYATTQAGFDYLNTVDFEPGDRILLAGGTTFSGKLILGSSDTGTDPLGNLIAPLIVTSFGTGRATISAGDDSAIALQCGELLLDHFVSRCLQLHSLELDQRADLARDREANEVLTRASSGHGARIVRCVRSRADDRRVADAAPALASRAAR